MTVELLQTLSLISYIVAGVFALVSVALFFFLDIKKVVGDITGATARKAIKKIREQNEESGDKAYKPSPVNLARGKITDEMTPSGRLRPQTAGIALSPGTEKFDTAELVQLAEETMPLEPPGAETTLLNESVGETAVLPQSSGYGETAVLPVYSYEPAVSMLDESIRSDFSTDVEIGFTDSSEIIE